jgi:hypothetical protein
VITMIACDQPSRFENYDLYLVTYLFIHCRISVVNWDNLRD